VSTGLTDLDYSEVLAGLKAGDQVYMLPSSGLVETQQRFQQRMSQFSGMPGQQAKRPEGGRPEGGRPERNRGN
jgi:hypothetical protein